MTGTTTNYLTDLSGTDLGDIFTTVYGVNGRTLITGSYPINLTVYAKSSYYNSFTLSISSGVLPSVGVLNINVSGLFINLISVNTGSSCIVNYKISNPTNSTITNTGLIYYMLI